MPAQILTYPKTRYTEEQVKREKTRFHYPRAWEFKEDRNNFYLILHESWMKKHYFSKTRPTAMQIGRCIGVGIMGRR